MWVYLGIASALFLGFYDVFKKCAVNQNAVPAVLFLSTCFGALITAPVLGLSLAAPDAARAAHLYAEIPPLRHHLLIVAKTALVAVSWITAYFALKNLPISIVSPIRASAPLWTLVGAVFLFGEALRPVHWLGISVIFSSYYLFSILGRREGIHFSRDPHILLVFVATLTGAMSALYDKYLLHEAAIPPVTLQVWFSLYLVVATGAMWLGLRRALPKTVAGFEWRRSIPLIGVFLILADYLYFKALHHPEALIAVISVIRRSSVVISFLVGSALFREKNRRAKLVALLGVLVGVVVLVSGE